jgi:hypothetical protein
MAVEAAEALLLPQRWVPFGCPLLRHYTPDLLPGRYAADLFVEQ